MNPPDAFFWMRLFGIFALEILAVVAVAFLAEMFVKSIFWRRTIWQVMFLGLLLLFVADATGFGRGLAVWFTAKAPVERKFSVRTFPVEQNFVLQSEEPTVVPDSISQPEILPEEKPVWWPAAIWVMGFTIVFGRIAFSRLLLLTLSREKNKIKESVLVELVFKIASRLGLRRKIRLLQTKSLVGPIAFGVLRPSIGLPLAFKSKFSSVQQETMLAHELAHLAARDPFWYFMADIATTIFWWHPFVWLARRRLHATSEMAADEATALIENGPSTLAECLVSLGRQLSNSRGYGSLGVTGFRSNLGKRVERLLNLKTQEEKSLRGLPLFFARTVFTVLLAGLVIISSGWIQNRNETRGNDWRSTIQESWNDSFGSFALTALTEQGTAVSSDEPSKDQKFENKTHPQNDEEELKERKNKAAVLLQEGKLLYEVGKVEQAQDKLMAAIRTDPKNEEVQRYIVFLSKESIRARELLPPKAQSAALSQHGKLFYEMGKVENAEKSLKEALRLDPENKNAKYYLDLIEKAKHQVPKRNTKLIHPTQPMKRVEEKGKSSIESEESLPSSITVPKEVKSKGVVHISAGRAEIISKLDKIRLDAFYDGLPLGEVLKALAKEVIKRDPDKMGLNFMIQSKADASVAAGPLDPNTPSVIIKQEAPIDISAVRIQIDPELQNLRLADVLEAIVSVADQPIKFEVKDYGIVFSPRSPKAVVLVNGQFKVEPNTFLPTFAKTNDTARVNEMLRLYFTVPGIDMAPPKSVYWNDRAGVLLVRALSTDLDLIERTVAALNAPLAQNVAESVAPKSLSETNSNLAEKIQENGEKKQKPLELVNRQYKVDPNTFLQALESVSASTGGRGGGGGNEQDSATFRIPRDVGGLLENKTIISAPPGQSGKTETHFVTKTNRTARVNEMVREYFAASGIDMTPPKSIFWHDRSGILLVRASPADMDLIGAAVDALNVVAPQIMIEARFAEIDDDGLKALGMDWFFKDSGGSRSNLIGGTFKTPPTKNVAVGETNVPNSIMTNITAILSEPQFKIVLRALEKRKGTDVLSAPRVTTLSGRQAQVSVLDLHTIVTGVKNIKGSDGAITNEYQTSPLPFGTVLDVIPSLLADEFSIQMSLVATVTEFLGYDNADKFPPAGAGAQTTLPLPRYRTRQVTTAANVYDGQTIVLGGLVSETVEKTKNKVPFVGGVPLIGKLFRSETSRKVKKNLIVFITPTVVDPAGNRLHNGEEVEKTAHSIPPQPTPGDKEKILRPLKLRPMDSKTGKNQAVTLDLEKN